jgi:BioD-like phosphotransacetylase family protein|tara:strand:+ start:265 stop:1305 length:1041 start_codon:yes stop_codon:yes gene_type:complete
MRKFYITSNQEKSGKTILSDALAFQLHQRGLKTAYSKLSYIEEPNNTVNNEKSLSYLENSKYFKNIYLPPLITSDIDSIKKSANLAQKEIKKLEAEYSTILIEGTNNSTHPDNSPLDIELAEQIDASIIRIIWYQESTMGEGDISFIVNDLAKYANHLAGVVINGVPKNRLHYAQTILKENLITDNIPILAILPQDSELNARTFDEIITFLQGNIIAFEDNVGELIDTIMLGALALDGGIYYYGQSKKKIVITRWDRPDLQMPALVTGCQGLILTGGQGPIPYVLDRINKLKVPVAIVQEGTVAIATKLSDGFLSERGDPHPDKSQKLSKMLESYPNFSEELDRII